MNSFHFLRPEWFFALPPLLALLLWLWRRQLRSRSWQAVCDPELLPHLLLGRSVRRANWPFWLLFLGLLLALVALAGPVWKRQPQPLFRQQSALVILFDLSRSMQAADLKPSRFLRARLKIEDLLRQRKEGQTALIAFAGDAFTVTPLTEDRHTIEALLKSLTPDLMPVQGSDPARAIQRGQRLLQQAGLKQGRLLLVTDEDQPESATKAAQALHRKGYTLEVLGLGTSAGAPIPLADGGFLKDSQGDLVLPRLNAAGLQRLAGAGGGNFHRLTIDNADLKALLSGLGTHRLDQAQATSGTTGVRWREEGVWLLWPLVLLAAFSFRRGWLLVLTLLLLVPPSAEALSWPELWQRPDQRAATDFKKQDYAAAAQQFHNPRWKASALYRSGKFAAAAKVLKKSQNADDWYNKGNALARSGALPAALKAYQQALRQNPAHPDAEYNKKLVEKALQQQKQRQPNKKTSSPKSRSGHKKQSASGGKQQQSSPSADGSHGKKTQNNSRKAESDSQKAAQQHSGQQPKKRSESPADKPAAAAKKEESQPNSASTKSVQSAEKAAQNKAPKSELSTSGGRDKTGTSAQQRESRLLLQQIPDDPGGLLRRKFLYQYRQRGQQRETDRSW